MFAGHVQPTETSERSDFQIGSRNSVPSINEPEKEQNLNTEDSVRWKLGQGIGRSPDSRDTSRRANFLRRTNTEIFNPTNSPMNIKHFFNRSVANRVSTIIKQQDSQQALNTTISNVMSECVEEELSSMKRKYLDHSNTLQISEILEVCTNSQDIEQRKQAVAPLFKSKYPQKKWTVWSFSDVDGIVYGWNENLYFFLVGEQPIVIEILLTFTKSQLAMLNRKLALFQKKTGKVNRKVVILCGSAEDDALKQAAELKYDVQLPG